MLNLRVFNIISFIYLTVQHGEDVDVQLALDEVRDDPDGELAVLQEHVGQGAEVRDEDAFGHRGQGRLSQEHLQLVSEDISTYILDIIY